MVFEHGATIPAGRFIQPRIEAEIAFVMKDAIDGGGAGKAITRDDILAATDYVAPAIEMLDTRTVCMDVATGKIRKVFDTISDNAANAGVVLGAGVLNDSKEQCPPASAGGKRLSLAQDHLPLFRKTCDRVSRTESTSLSQFEVIYIVTNGDE